ncbi:MAG: glutamate--tRNA ligase [Eubacteriales bacterium]|nr:glutamate--tRNA ligase [Eubacteriales bacterium]
MLTRTRYAPSPTGRMHIGNLRTALYAYLIAKHDDGKFLLRIEDTDREREVSGAVEIIYNTLKIAKLFHDEGPDIGGDYGPYVQSERMKQGIYMKYAMQLVKEHKAYYCFCSKERLESLQTIINGEEIIQYDKHCLNLSESEIQDKLNNGCPFVIRQNILREGNTSFDDEIYGTITVDNSELDDMVLIKSDGYPTYNFANVIDDHLMKITHVVRGNEYLSSTPKYNLLYEAFGWDIPKYIHCPLITDENHKKLSKRSGHSSFEDLLDLGLLPEAVLNFVVLLGWSSKDNKEILSLNELIKTFDYNRISKSPAVFDMVKLRWMNGEYIKMMNDEDYLIKAKLFIKKFKNNNVNLNIDKILLFAKSRIETFLDIQSKISFFESAILKENGTKIDETLFINKKLKLDIELSIQFLKEILLVIEKIDDFSNDNIFSILSAYGKDKGYKIAYMMWPIRIALSGEENTICGATDIMSIIGKEETIIRIKNVF